MILIATADEHAHHFHLLETWFAGEWGELDSLTHPDGLYPPPLVAVDENDELLGGLAFTQADVPAGDDAGIWINAVFVRPNSRGDGIAGRLVEAAEAIASRHGIATLFVFTDVPQLYAKRGWTVRATHGQSTILARELTGNARGFVPGEGGVETQPEIRAYQPSDEAGVVHLWQLVFPDEPEWNESLSLIHQKLTTQPDLFFVCVADGDIVGTAIAGYDGVRGWVHKVATHPGYRGRHIGRLLMATAESALAERGCVKLNLQVRAGNANAVGFYQSVGYQEEARVSMSKRLAPGGAGE